MLVRNDAVFIGVLDGGWVQRLKAEEGTARAWPPLNALLGSATCAQDNSSLRRDSCVNSSQISRIPNTSSVASVLYASHACAPERMHKQQSIVCFCEAKV